MRNKNKLSQQIGKTGEQNFNVSEQKFSTSEQYQNTNLDTQSNSAKSSKSVKTAKSAFALYVAIILCTTLFTTPAFATTTDPLAVVNNLSDFIFGLIRAIGMILLGWGVVQVGLSLQSHDPSQRSNGFLTLAGGLVITFAKEILDLIVGV